MHGTCIKTVERYILQQPGCDEANHEKPTYVVGLWAGQNAGIPRIRSSTTFGGTTKYQLLRPVL
jgi:hypothetical protein